MSCNKKSNGCNFAKLDNAWVYSCPQKNINYSAFNSGVNCLCAGTQNARSTFDQYVMEGKQWPVSTDSFGWDRKNGDCCTKN